MMEHGIWVTCGAYRVHLCIIVMLIIKHVKLSPRERNISVYTDGSMLSE